MAVEVDRVAVNEVDDQDLVFRPRSFSWRIPDIALALLRVVAGLMFVQHGVQKHFGLLMPPDQAFRGAPEMFSMMWIAGTLEIVGGVMLAIGLLTRPVAFLLSGQMAVAYFMVHFAQGFWPILNGGELAALYCFIFLAFAAIGGGPFSIDGLMGRRHGVPAERRRGYYVKPVRSARNRRGQPVDEDAFR